MRRAARRMELWPVRASGLFERCWGLEPNGQVRRIGEGSECVDARALRVIVLWPFRLSPIICPSFYLFYLQLLAFISTTIPPVLVISILLLLPKIPSLDKVR